MKELSELHKFKMEGLTYTSPAQKILKEHLQNLDKLKDIASPYHKLMESLNIAIPNISNTITELSTKNEKIYQSIGLNNSEFEKVINNLKNNNIPFEASLWSKIGAIIKDSKIDYLKNLNENRFNLIQDNFKDIGINSEIATIAFLENINEQVVNLSEDEINDLSIDTANFINNSIIKSNLLVIIVTNYLNDNPSIKFSIKMIYRILSIILGAYIGSLFSNNSEKDKPKEIVTINNYISSISDKSTELYSYKINSDNALLKNSNSNNSRTVAKLKLNTEIIILKNNRKWVYVFVKNDQIISGWVRKEFIDFPEK